MDYRNGYVFFDEGWECTDPDEFQFCKKLSDTEFSYCQLANDEIKNEIKVLSLGHLFDVPTFLNNRKTGTCDWYSGDVDINDYDSDEIGEVMSAYDGVLDMCKGDESCTNQITAECIFETYMLTDFNNNI